MRYKNKLYSFGGFDEKNSRYFNDVHCFDIGVCGTPPCGEMWMWSSVGGRARIMLRALRVCACVEEHGPDLQTE